MKFRKFLFIIILFVSTHTANSQVLIALIFGDALNTGQIEFGLDGGWTLAYMDGIEGAKPLSTWNLGFYFDIKLKDPAWMVHTGVIVKSVMGTTNTPLYPLNDPVLDSAFVGGSVTKTQQHFYVPIMMKYKFRSNIFVEGGIMVGLFRKSTDTFVNSVQETDDLSYEIGSRKPYHLFDGGLMVGAGYRLKSINVGIRFYYGLVDVNADVTLPSLYNRALYVNIGIPIGAHEPEEEPEE
ncbi:MAG: outer membrane beta-barrel protein [Desulfobacteraceae bacterium]|nr:outer membrane beta-barrel protein [Desulfobacteraceae bacterium]